MDRMFRILKYRPLKVSLLLIALPLLHIVAAPVLHAQGIVRIISEGANIHSEPEPTVEHIIQAQLGDTFEMERRHDEWIGIHMFSGEIRYLMLEDAEIDYDLFHQQPENTRVNNVCQEVQEVATRAAEAAGSLYPDDEEEADAYQNLLIDRQLLTLFRERSIPATHNTVFLDCVNDFLLRDFKVID